MARLTGVLGIFLILLFAYLFSTDRKAIRPRTVVVGLALQICFAVLVLRVSYGVRLMSILGDGANKLLSYSYVGSQFVFGDLGSRTSKYGVLFAFQILPIIIFIAAFFGGNAVHHPVDSGSYSFAAGDSPAKLASLLTPGWPTGAASIPSPQTLAPAGYHSAM